MRAIGGASTTNKSQNDLSDLVRDGEAVDGHYLPSTFTVDAEHAAGTAKPYLLVIFDHANGYSKPSFFAKRISMEFFLGGTATWSCSYDLIDGGQIFICKIQQ